MENHTELPLKLMKNDDALEIAKIGRTIGLRGDLKLHIMSDFVEQFQKGSRFFTKKRGELIIKHFDKQRMLVRFEDYENKEKAQSLVNVILLTSIEQTRQNCKLKKDEFFWFDMINLDIFEEDLHLGFVSDISRIGGQDYLCVNTAENLIKQGHAKSFLIPYIDRFIVQTDIETKKIQVLDCFDILQSS